MSQLAKLGSMASRAIQHVNKVAGNDAFEMLTKLKKAGLNPADRAALATLEEGLEDATLQVGKGMIAAQKGQPVNLGAAMRAEQMVNTRIKELGGQIAALKGRIESAAVAAGPAAPAAAAGVAERTAMFNSKVAELTKANQVKIDALVKAAPNTPAALRALTPRLEALKAELAADIAKARNALQLPQ